MAFEWEKTLVDARNFVQWVSRHEGDADKSWRAWYKEEISFIAGLDFGQRVRTPFRLWALTHLFNGRASNFI